ncbi:alpha,alpha-trehalase TreF [Arcticibacter tournemirensis]|uniref:Alpha,alpha-trehalase TreF n=2 Tax=Arcticibacter tournemirensis TaxID=699437 RepID=A0A5M9HA24_9SPHI|nr:alpha,alpha-trehalase TreF [Arcticibacter tournemirensis]
MNLKPTSFLSVVLILISLASCKEKKMVKHDSPRDLYPALFEAVQSAGIFEDSKTFPDCTPKGKPDDIIQEYRENKSKPDFNLHDFVEKNFELPDHAGSIYKSDIKAGVEAHINELWKVLQRNPDKYAQYTSLISLPFPYIVPGGRFREIYYWDSYFTMLGLEESGRGDLVENMLNNFAFLIRTYGFIPNGNRTYYLTRSQPPYFSLMLKLLMENKKGKADSVLKANLDVLEKEYHFWMNNGRKKEIATGHVVHLPDGSVMNRYFDAGDWPREEAYNEDVTTAVESKRPKSEVYRDLRSGAESGWDFSSRWFADGRSLPTVRTTAIIPVDLNCLLYHLEQMLAIAYNRDGDGRAHKHMLEQARLRKNAILRYCWDRNTGWFKDYDWKEKVQTQSLNLAATYPLYFKIATQGQADSVAQLLNQRFLKPGGLVTTLVNTGQQWDSPNGWAPLQWMAIAGLKNYNKNDLSSEIADRWSRQNIRVFNKTGKLLEKYNVTDTTLIAGGGEYPNQDGFGWTNGVLLKILKMEGKKDLNKTSRFF